jgi:hypothetical protein
MASIHQYFNETQVVWQPFGFSKTGNVAVTEVWRQNEDIADITFPIHQTISKQELPGWLRQTSSKLVPPETPVQRHCVLRIVWILCEQKRRIFDVDAVLFAEICAAFRHQLAQVYCKTQYVGVGSIVDQGTGKDVYFLCNYPKLVVTWSQDPVIGVTSMICVADRRKLDILQDMMENKFVQELAHNKLTPALVSALLISKEIDIVTCEVKRVVREVELRTGYHEWTGRDEDSAGGDLVGLLARMSGWGAKVESSTRKLGVIAEFSKFIRDQLEDEKNIKEKDELLALNLIIERRTAMQVLNLKYSISRIRTQKEAVSSPISVQNPLTNPLHKLFNLIAANDSASAQYIAEKSRQIAWATRSDAQSMKLLTLMTTVFLPGTFVSGLFSTPIFQRDPGESAENTILKVWRPGLYLYIAVSLPLLLMTLLVWGVWTFGHKLKNERHIKMARGRFLHRTKYRYTEKENLIMRQNAFLQKAL